MNIQQMIVLAGLTLLAGSCGDAPSSSTTNATPEAPAVGVLTYSMVRSYPHDTSSYTQGLVVYKGRLYEGTGQYGASSLLQTVLTTGVAVQKLSLDNAFFGEGITILRDTIYQLTWKEKSLFVYDLNFKKIRTVPIDKEGWGLTHNGSELILSNGSGDLFFYEPATMKLLRVQTVTEAGSPSFNLNELEYIDGYVYANQYTYPYILKIDPSNGQVVAKADITRLWEQSRQAYPNAEVPNGIAYDSDQKKIYVTGKWWPLLYEVQFSH